MPLSAEDNLRLNVLLAQKLQAVRLNESTLIIYALTEKGEAKVVLNPNCRDELYLRQVKELFSMRIMGSPGGYPIFIKRWTRMGQRRKNVKQLLLLGEPEAVVAVAQSPGISHEIGRRVWWCDPSVENARSLLKRQTVVQGELGKEIASFLLEFLPFEARQLDIAESVSLCLQDDLISNSERQKLWLRAKRKNPYYVGFLMGSPDNLLLEKPEHPNYATLKQQVSTIQDNLIIQDLLWVLSAKGQAWLATIRLALTKPTDQEVVVALFIAINAYFHTHFPEHRGVRHIDRAIQRAERLCKASEKQQASDELQMVLNHIGQYKPLLESLLVLAQLGENTLNPIFSGSDSIGSVMRKHLKPLTTALLIRIDVLQTKIC